MAKGESTVAKGKSSAAKSAGSAAKGKTAAQSAVAVKGQTAVKGQAAVKGKAAAKGQVAVKGKAAAAKRKGDEFQRLPWTFGLLMEIPDRDMENLPVGEGVQIAVEGRLDRASYVYLVQIAAKRDVTVLYPAGGEHRKIAAARAARVPPEGWARSTKKGRVRAIASSRPLSVSDLLAILEGREPPPGNATIKNA
jgi:hypothetical protein